MALNAGFMEIYSKSASYRPALLAARLEDILASGTPLPQTSEDRLCEGNPELPDWQTSMVQHGALRICGGARVAEMIILGKKFVTIHLETLREDVAGVFDPTRFAIPRFPVPMGHLRTTSTIMDLPACLDMPIKLPGGNITLPQPYIWSRAITGMLEQIMAFEDNLLPEWRETRYLYLTVDTRWVEPGRTHRNAGFHFDGMQGSRYPQKLPVCHQYVASTASPTEFSGAALDATKLDEMKHNWFEELGNQIPADQPLWSPAASEIVCMSAYQLHRSPVATRHHLRSFIRVDVSVKQQDRLGNTPNPELAVPWKYVERSMPPGLQRAISDSSWDGVTRMAA